MSGIYLHIPFCKKACHYCNFHFSTSMRHADKMIAAIHAELQLRKKEAQRPVETIYFGGGTPSVLSKEHIVGMLDQVHQHYDVIQSPEITLEANPDDLTLEYMQALQEAGINRLSIGIQSFHDSELKLMNRAHNASQALSSVTLAKKEFDNVSIDLLFGNPNTTLDDWKRNLDHALQLEVPHISSYALTLEPKTALERFVDKGLVSLLDENVVEAQFHHLVDTLTQAGYDHYELSSFGKPGYHSQNNTGYWQGKTYLGIGPSAHGFDGNQRYWNVSNNASYMQQITKGELPQTIEKLSVVDIFNESIMIGLRASWGVSLQAMENKLGLRYRQHLEDQAKRFMDEGLLHIENNALKTTRKGAFLADGISAELFLIDWLGASP
ncbi:MAG: radical SAM family heme chaperone HemW [Flavobacteriaceae bacterium]|jgi:oxygen-independent coproporphyrinogen-3 oxidase|nr:radical SAM family heme chaperone HemW [Flavobacteriaceae bacterium]MDG0967523.1 radical SAM family heme chaperone HemW [Flavobacteriaceae bacterium]